MAVDNIINDMESMFLDIYSENLLEDFENLLNETAQDEYESEEFKEMFLLIKAKIGIIISQRFVDEEVSAKVKNATNIIDARIKHDYRREQS